MSGESKIDKAETVAAELNSETEIQVAEQDMASQKDRVSSDSTSSVSSSGDVTNCIKMKIDRESVGERGVDNRPTSGCNYYYPGCGMSYAQFKEQRHFQADSSHMSPQGPQSDSGSVVYCMPGYSPSASGTVVGVDGQFHGQQPCFSSSGYLQHSGSYGSEAVPCHSWNSTYVGDTKIVKPASPNNFAKSNGFNSAKASGGVTGKFPQSTYTQQRRSLSKVPQFGSNFSACQRRGYHPAGKYSAFPSTKQGHVSDDGPVNYRSNGRAWNGNDNSRFTSNSNGDFETSTEITCGPRGNNNSAHSDTSDKDGFGITTLRRDKYNLPDFQTHYDNAKFYVIKSYSEDDVHKCIKYSVWSSTPNGNKKLDAAYHDAEAKARETGSECPIFLFFSVNGSGQFVGVAEMIGKVDFNKDMDFWQLDKWIGFFPVQWHIIKDIPNSQLRHIILENNDNEPVTHTRDTQEIELKHGLEMLNIFKSYSAKTSVLDDFNFYEDRQKTLIKNKDKPATLRIVELYGNGDDDDGNFDDYAMKQQRKNREYTGRGYRNNNNPSSLINLTKNLSLNGSTSNKSNPVKHPIRASYRRF